VQYVERILDSGSDGSYGHYGVLTLHDPSRLNAMSVTMGECFESIINQICARDLADGHNKLRAVILTGSGKAFSAGGDLEWIQQRATDTALNNSTQMRRFYERFLSIRRLPVPTIAAINGAAVGAGMCVALACDQRIAAANAKIGFTFVDLGIHPGMGSTHMLPQLVGPERAFSMLSTGKLFSGREAREQGLVLESVDPFDATDDSGRSVLHRAAYMAMAIADKPTAATRSLTRSFRLRMETGFEQSLWREAVSTRLFFFTILYWGVSYISD
jgi:enoyl-CoA hydratase/carnithine racemase